MGATAVPVKPWSRRGRAERASLLAVGALVLVNLVFVAMALARSDDVVSDGSGSVTNGWIISGGILLTLLVVAGLQVVPLPHSIRHTAQILALFSQALHSGGHLFRFYYDYRYYDDVLHTFLTAALAVLLHAAAIRPFPHRLVRPLRTFAAIVVLSVAAAGIWEIFEYSADSLLGTREQDDLQDTMQDMIDGTVGGTLFGMVAAWLNARAIRKDPKRWGSYVPMADDDD